MKIILCREQFIEPRIGCCGMVRSDAIYPIGNTINFETFKNEVFDLINNYDDDKDIYSLEYFEGEYGQEKRGNGKSIYLFILEKDNNWHFYENGIEKFKVNNLEELKILW